MGRNLKRVLIVCCLGIVTAILWARQREVPEPLIVVLAGQSNMVGWADSQQIPEAFRFQPSNVTLFVNGQPARLGGGPTFGPEVSFAHAISRAFPRHEIILHKFAENGTSLLAWSPIWTPELAARTGNGPEGPLYHQLIEMVSRNQTNPPRPIDAFLWMQGERDARHADVAEGYGRNLAGLVASLRYDFRSPDAAFIFGEICSFTQKFPFVEVVRLHQEDAPFRIPLSYMVATDDLPKREDQVHFNAIGEVQLGLRFADAFIEHMKYHPRSRLSRR